MRERLQTFAGKVAYISVEDALHCRGGCSALRLRRAKGAQKSPVLFWTREKGGETHPMRVTVAPRKSPLS